MVTKFGSQIVPDSLGVFQLCAPKAPFQVCELKLQQSLSGH